MDDIFNDVKKKVIMFICVKLRQGLWDVHSTLGRSKPSKIASNSSGDRSKS